MEFKRRRIRGQDRRKQKTWMDERKCYRIYWRREAWGVSLHPCFYAFVRCIGDGIEFWEFAGARHPYKTIKAAHEACKANEKIWSAVIALNDEKHFTLKLKDLQRQAVAGHGPLAHSMLASLPKWVAGHVRPQILSLICSSPQDRTETSKTSPPNINITGLEESGLASPAVQRDASTTQTTRPTQLKDTDTAEPSTVPSARAAVRGRRKNAKQSTEKPLKISRRGRRLTKHSSKQETNCPKHSRRSKSKRSEK